MSYNAYETLLQKTGKVCPDGRLEYLFEGTSKECIEPTSQADCPSGFEFVQIPKDMTRTNRGTGTAGKGGASRLREGTPSRAVRRHATTGGHCSGFGNRTGAATDGRALRRRRRFDSRRTAADAGQAMAGS